MLLFWCLDNQWIDIYRSGEVSTIWHFLPYTYFFVAGSSDTIVKVQLIKMSELFTLLFSLFGGFGDLHRNL